MTSTNFLLINKPISEPTKAWQLNSRDCTLKQNRTSGLENNQGEVADGPQSALKNKF